jgi:hypothetical protein
VRADTSRLTIRSSCSPTDWGPQHSRRRCRNRVPTQLRIRCFSALFARRRKIGGRWHAAAQAQIDRLQSVGKAPTLIEALDGKRRWTDFGPPSPHMTRN